MRLLKNVRRECDGLGLAMVCILIAVTILAGSGAAGTAGAPKTVAEIALYQGPDREKILIEGAKKEGQL
ncbi:MAG TPA: hypothetical protein VJZ16_07090, partial [Syntrophales bacterium]|nr:hypothetical protein [Syntrophales bacterium]